MSLKAFQFCPACRATLRIEPTIAQCTACSFIYYENPAPGAGIVLIDDDRVLVAIRAIAPHHGAVDIIGGFMQRDETPECAALRELKEETGLEAEITGFLGAFPDTYGPGGKPTINFIYLGRITRGKMQANDDVAELRWIPIDELPTDQGFPHVQRAFAKLQSHRAE